MYKINLARVKAERIAKRMTQEEIAKGLGMKTTMYNKRELGHISFTADEFAKIVSVLEFDREQAGLFFEEVNETA